LPLNGALVVQGGLMKFAKCPSCGEYQGLKKVLFLTNFGTRKCESCKTEYETIKSKTILATIAIIFPLFIGKHLPIFSSYPLITLLWVLAGLAILFKHMPLKVVNN